MSWGKQKDLEKKTKNLIVECKEYVRIVVGN